MKKQNLLVTVLFCAFLGGMCLLSLLLPKRAFSELENRSLAAAPKLTGERLLSGRFMEDAEQWTADHAPLRDRWAQLKALAERAAGKRENDGVYLAAQDTLISRLEEPDEDLALQNAAAVRTLAEKLPVPLCLGLIPTAASVWADRLPAGAPTLDEAAWTERLYEAFGGPTLDLAGALNAHREEPVFYRTDHHWTSLGARWAADAVFEALELPPLAVAELEPRVVSEDFRGTTWSRAGAWWIPPDEIRVMVPEAGVRVASLAGGKEEPGALYVPSWLEKKNQYAFFLGGNQPACVIRTEAQGPKLLLLRDSFSDSLAPFLCLRCSEIHLLDLRYYRQSVSDYVRDNGIDQVLVLYSLPEFLSDRNLAHVR